MGVGVIPIELNISYQLNIIFRLLDRMRGEEASDVVVGCLFVA